MDECMQVLNSMTECSRAMMSSRASDGGAVGLLVLLLVAGLVVGWEEKNRRPD